MIVLASGAQFERSQVSVNESVGSFEVFLQRGNETASSTATGAFMTLEEFSQRNAEGSCQPNVAMANFTADQAEGQ